VPSRILLVSIIAAALIAAPKLAGAQSAPFCLKSASGALSCTYHSMILCEQAKQPHSRDQCIPRFQADETTGSSAAPLGNPHQPAARAPAATPGLER
jgi:hypothetical protein